MLKVELHTHTSDDPVDNIPYSTCELIDRAAQLGYDALAVTLHDRQLDLRPFVAYANQRGITLIPGIERTIEGRHVLLLNFTPATEWVESFDDLADLKAKEPRGLVVAPHAFFPIRTSLRGLMNRHAGLFDAVECNAMFTGLLDFNRTAQRWARVHGKPMVGNGDVHRLRQLGSTYSLVDAPPEAGAICEAIRNGRVEVRARPLSVASAATIMWQLVAGDLIKAWIRQLQPRHS
ncbi:MAG TPA: PHP-associated domain-containing protein [Vicinamibacterales bacterium]|nr:PHP-associated domain-containing protein [Vicinamibacterales bacterium]